MELLFVPEKLPRTWTKAQWKEADRWRRITQKKLAEARQQLMENLAVYGTTHPRIRENILNELTNPPLLLGPRMEKAFRAPQK
jgi:hypothetical protein